MHPYSVCLECQGLLDHVTLLYCAHCRAGFCSWYCLGTHVACQHSTAVPVPVGSGGRRAGSPRTAAVFQISSLHNNGGEDTSSDDW